MPERPYSIIVAAGGAGGTGGGSLGVDWQRVCGFVAGLLRAGVEPSVIEEAVCYSLDLRPGQPLSGGDPLVRAFIFEQVRLLERAR